MNSLPTLGKDRRKKKLQNIALKPFQIKSFKSNLKVHNHENDSCPVCKNEILKTRVNGRGTYYCKNCQK